MHEDPEKITYFAQTNSRGVEAPFGIKRRDRARHMYVIGKTGMGKSTLLENMAIQDIRNGEGMAFIDPHGSTAERLLEYVPESRIDDVLYFAPFDMDNPIAFNIMEDVGYDKRHLVVSGLLSAFRKIWVDAWSARMEYILSNTLLALLEYEGATLLDVNRMLINKAFRKKVVENVKDPIVKSFWVDEFANYTDRYTQDATPAIQNKIGQFTSNPLIRNIVGQPKSSFDIRDMMDKRKVLIMNLSKGRVGEVNATLLGSMLVTKIYLAAMSRADVPANTLAALPNFYFYVDEFQSFANESFADILSEARKYKLNLLIAHQYVEQMEEEVRNAVFGNVGTTVAFRVGPFDAETLETIFMPQFTKEDLVNLGFAQIYLTLMINGVGSPPFSATTLPPFDPPPMYFTERVIESSRKAYGRPRQDVEQAIKEWQAVDVAPPPEPRKNSYGQRTTGARPASGPRYEQRSAPRATAPQKPAEDFDIDNPPFEVAEGSALAPERGSEPAPPALHLTQAPLARESRPPHAERKPHAPRQESREPRASKDAPPLEGATSLRDAIAMATKGTAAPEKAHPEPARHAADLKDALKKIAPVQPPKQERKTHDEAHGHDKHDTKNEKTPHRPAGLPEQDLRAMLDVGDIDGGK